MSLRISYCSALLVSALCCLANAAFAAANADTADGSVSFTQPVDHSLASRLPALYTELDHIFAPYVTATSPSGDWLASGGSDNAIKLWSAHPRVIQRTLHGHRGGVSALAFGGEHLLASGSFDERIRLWDVDSGTLLRELAGHKRYIEFLHFSSDCTRLVSVDRNGVLKLWRVADGSELASLTLAEFPYRRLQHIALTDKRLTLVAKGGERRDYNLAGDSLQRLETTSGAPLLRQDQVTRSSAAAAKSDQASPRLFANRAWVRQMVLSPDGNTLISGHGDGSIRFWDINHRRQVGVIGAHSDEVFALALSADGSRLLSSGRDNRIRLWDVAQRRLLREFDIADSLTHNLAFGPHDKLVASSSFDKVFIWRIDTGEKLTTFSADSYIFDLVFSSDGKHILTGTEDNYMKQWAAGDGRLEKTYRSHTGDVLAVAYSPDGKQVASASFDETVKIYDRDSERLLRTLRGHTEAITDLAYNAAGDQLATVSFDRTVRVWDVARGRQRLRLQGHSEPVRCILWPAASTQLISGAMDASLRFWNIDNRSNNSVLFSLEHGEWVSVSLDAGLQASSRAAVTLIKAPQGSSGEVTLPELIDRQHRTES